MVGGSPLEPVTVASAKEVGACGQARSLPRYASCTGSLPAQSIVSLFDCGAHEIASSPQRGRTTQRLLTSGEVEMGCSGRPCNGAFMQRATSSSWHRQLGRARPSESGQYYALSAITPLALAAIQRFANWLTALRAARQPDAPGYRCRPRPTMAHCRQTSRWAAGPGFGWS